VTEYFVIRILLACCLSLLIRPEIPKPLRRYTEFMTVNQLLPQFLTSAQWWRAVWVPLEIIQAVLGFYVCSTIFAMATEYKTYRSERTYILAFAFCIASVFVIAAWIWSPQNLFQDFTIIRQYYRLILLVVCLLTSVWFGLVKPIETEKPLKVLVTAWTIWLACQFIMSTTGSGGLLWSFADRYKNGLFWYRIVNDLSMLIQCIVVVWAAYQIRKKVMKPEIPYVLSRQRYITFRYSYLHRLLDENDLKDMSPLMRSEIRHVHKKVYWKVLFLLRRDINEILNVRRQRMSALSTWNFNVLVYDYMRVQYLIFTLVIIGLLNSTRITLGVNRVKKICKELESIFVQGDMRYA
jgi:hypothetical protein